MSDELKKAQHALAFYKKRLAEIAACETPNANATVRRMARLARCEIGEGITPRPVVDAGPVPDGTTVERLKECLVNTKGVLSAFEWCQTKQGYDYWRGLHSRETLTPEARAIIETWIAELERDA
jgi:hypothetical protein